jgi:hypothetical protein
MNVKLNGDNFNIKPLSDSSQLVLDEGFTNWEYDVIPLKSGTQILILNIAIRIKIMNYSREEVLDYPVFEKKIKVEANPSFTFLNLLEIYWQWAIGTIITLLCSSSFIAWLLNKRKKNNNHTSTRKHRKYIP